MKRNEVIVGVVGCLIALALPGLAVGQNAVSIGPYSPPNPGPAVPAVPSQTLLPDGSFENGAPPASGWTETANNACEWIGEFAALWGVANYDGTFDYWGAGYCGGVPSTDSVSQSVSIPAGTQSLTFWYYILRVDADDANADSCYVDVDGNQVWSTGIMTADNSVAWEPGTANVSAWAGQTVTLTAGCTSAGTATGNIRFDYFEWVEGVPTAPNAVLIALVALLLVIGALLLRRRQTV